MSTHYNYPIDQWNAAKAEMRDILINCAKLGETIAYSELVQQVKAIHFEPDSHIFHTMLGEISSEEDTAGRGMLSVIVVHKEGDMKPGKGFFELASSLGHNVNDTDAFWVRELDKVFASWKQQ